MTEQDNIPESFKKGFINELVTLVLEKQVREYSGRKRINITQSDGLAEDDQVVILRKSDYDNLMKEHHALQEQLNSIDNQKLTADAIGDKFLQPVKDGFNDIIDGLKADLKDKDKEINRLKAICHDYDKQVYSLGLLDILRHKNREMSDDFNSKIWITRPDDQLVTDTEVRKLNDPDGDSGGESSDSDNGGDAE